ncbi:MAG: hypothetical protein ISS28_03200 [Candidatus Cloacimonetes bacterium]|nr:hypothetical protein [Candidatus Cloacimonadota bacterium]
MTYLWNIITSQWQGILVGVIVVLLGGIVLFFGKKLINLFKNIPINCYKQKMQKKVMKVINSNNEEIGIPLLPKIELKIVSHNIPPEELENKLLVFVKKGNKSYVYANVITQVLNEKFLIDVKRHINQDIYDSAKFSMGKSLITKDNSIEYLDNFQKEAIRYYERKMEDLFAKEEILSLIEKEELMIKKRLFKTVLLQELYALGERMIGCIPTEKSKQESIELVDFLYDFARKEEYEIEIGDEPPLNFIRNYFKFGLVPVKKSEHPDLSKHRRAVRINIKNRAISVYILGWGKTNVELIKKDFYKWLQYICKVEFNNEWYLKKQIEYNISKYQKESEFPGICCIFRHKSWIPTLNE